MRSPYFIAVLLFHLSSIFWFKGIENSLFNWHFSWTISKLLPYILVATSGIGLALSLAKISTSGSKIIRLSLLSTLGILGFGLAFWMHPIYEGDFNGDGKKFQNPIHIKRINGDFVMIALPDCPYCHEAVGVLNKLQQRNPNMKISIVILSAFKESDKQFRKEAMSTIHVQNAEDLEAITQISGHSFPAFFHVKNGKVTEVWSNDQLGMPALDRIEGF